MGVINRNRRIYWVLFFVSSWLLSILIGVQGEKRITEFFGAWFGVRSRVDAFDGVRNGVGIIFLMIHTLWCALGIAASLKIRMAVATILLIGPAWMAAGLLVQDWDDPAWFIVLSVSTVAWLVSMVVAVIWWRFHSNGLVPPP
jgi:hypothetical protein